jgi:dolichol-phosphate mannosyltransferase
MKLSVVIPVHNEEGCIAETLRNLAKELAAARIDHEILTINDNSSDRSREMLENLAREIPCLRRFDSPQPHGFGLAVRKGLESYAGDAVAVYMADGSDTPGDLLRFFEVLQARSVDCVFGSRFMRGSRVVDYPLHKLFLNRLANLFVSFLFGLRYNDVTNAFKLYRRGVIDGVKPFLSHHFNLTVELPLKAIVRGYSYAVIPNQWINRKTGVSKLRIQEMGSRYLFIVLYCLLERWLSRGDYRRGNTEAAATTAVSDGSDSRDARKEERKEVAAHL